MKLNQLIAVEKGVKNRAAADLRDLHYQVQKKDLVAGLARTYEPDDDAGERLPGERKGVQIRAEDALARAAACLTDLFDLEATKEAANCAAGAPVVVDGREVIARQPVGTLLFLEKYLNEIHEFVAELPTLDAGEAWREDVATGVWATEPKRTVRSKKVKRTHVAYEATKEHPAQVVTYDEDVPVGTWTTVAYSGALPAARQRELLARVERLQRAVKVAREEANTAEAHPVAIAAAVFAYLFGA